MTFPKTRAYKAALYQFSEALDELCVDISSPQGDEVFKDIARMMRERPWHPQAENSSEALVSHLGEMFGDLPGRDDGGTK